MNSPTLKVLALTTGNILGPLLLFGGIGWYLTNLKQSNVYVLSGIVVAFICSNLLILITTAKYLRATAQSATHNHVKKP